MLSYRRTQRIPIRLFIDQFRGQEHWVGLSFNLSPGGLYLCQKPQPIPNEMGLELNLPGAHESIWTRAEVRFIDTHGGFMGVGLAFTAMPNKHHHFLREFVGSARRQLRAVNERRATIRRLAA